MRTPIHVMPTEAGPSARHSLTRAPGLISVTDLTVSAGPKNDQGRLVRVFLTERQARQLRNELSGLLGCDVPGCVCQKHKPGKSGTTPT
jgi:hypothetical protein